MAYSGRFILKSILARIYPMTKPKIRIRTTDRTVVRTLFSMELPR